MKGEVSLKQGQILEAAIKRFSHFGINKTTLTEIADDLSVSKPALFYYFHDKNSLITSVAEKIINETLAEFEDRVKSAGSVEEGLFAFVEVKRKYFKKYFLLAIQGESMDMTKVSSAIAQIYHQARKKTESLLSDLLQQGIERNEVKPVKTEETSKIILDTLSAFEYCMKGRKAIPETTDIDEMFNRQKEVLEMFLNGLKKE